MIITDGAQEDINQYIEIIIHTCDEPQTAKKYYDALYNELRRIEKYPKANAIIHNNSFPYGINVRRADFNKTAVLYTVNGHTVYVHRVFYRLYRFRLSAANGNVHRVMV
jgi:plasmid stabilization system protein ParE